MNAKLVVGGVVALGLVVALQLLRRTDPPGGTPESAAVPAPAAEVVADDDTRGPADEPAESPPAPPQSSGVANREPEPGAGAAAGRDARDPDGGFAPRPATGVARNARDGARVRRRERRRRVG